MAASVAATVLGVGVQELSETASAGERRRLRVGMLGATHVHAEEKLNVLRASRDYEFVGICEESLVAREIWEKQGVRLLSPENLLEQCEVVESAVCHHARDALRALEASQHVHVEKPPATTMGEMRQLLECAERRNRLLQVGYMWRYHPGFQKILEAVQRGWLGDTFQIHAAISNDLAPRRRTEWAEFKGGAFFDLASHVVDVTVRLLGRPRAVTSVLRQHDPARDELRDSNAVILDYDRVLVVISNSAIQPAFNSHRRFEVLGLNGSATLCPIEPPTLELELVKAAGPYLQGKQLIALPEYRRYEADFADLAAAVREHRQLRVSPRVELEVEESLLRASQML